jgi:23S rRNA (cytidine1920-2'-O)/16S rRNA (cytidine1409-2'-O)-methyltransferase
VARARRRLDGELVRRGLATDLGAADDLVRTGRVLVGGAPAGGGTRLVAPGEPVTVLPPPPRFVSRAGAKLDAALDRFGLDPASRSALDVGASTGGFTDCLLQRGASSVVALDVGHGHLHERLRRDGRVRVVERCNVRDLAPGRASDAQRRRVVGEPAPLVVVDVSFVSLRAVLDAVVGLAAPGADLVLLVKPQFEATRAEADRGRGVITEPAVWSRVLCEVLSALGERGAVIMGTMASPVRGSGGNVEFLVHAVAPPTTRAPGATGREALVAAAVAEAATEVP